MNRVAAILFLASVTLLAPGCGREGTPDHSSGERVAAKPVNVLLITLDTTRADRLGCYGYDKGRTPNLDAMASRGLRFRHAFTHVPLTLPSHASILTGMRPPEHGLRDNGRGKLDGEVPVLAELLAARGYRTGAFVASFVLDRRFGLSRGFETYDDRMTPPARGEEDLFLYENRADVVAKRAEAWLTADSKEPFFCWVHFFDPHLPYEPPEPFRSQLSDPYDGEVAFMDSQVGLLLDLLERQGLADRTLVIICGDHGESFGEHGEHGHGMLVYEATMRVPLILALPGRLGQGEVVDRVVGLSDVAPTVLQMAGVAPPTTMTGFSLLDAPETARSCYGESEFLHNSHGWASLRSLTTRRYRYIECPEPELYDRLADPEESQNLVSADVAMAQEMQDRLTAMCESMRTRRAATVAVDAAALDALRALGYLGGTGAPPRGPDTRPAKDPKAMMGLYNTCEQAGRLMAAGRADEGVELLKPLALRSPESAEIHDLLSRAFTQLRRPSDALPHMQAFLAANPTHRPMLDNLGVTLFHMGRATEATKIFRHALQLPAGAMEPANANGSSAISTKLRLHLAAVLALEGKSDEAETQYRMALEEQPDNVQARCELGAIYLRRAQYGPAEQLYRTGLKQSPNDATLLTGLAFALEHKDRTREAIDNYRKALENDPAVPSAALNLGNLLYGTKDYGKAIEVWRQGRWYRPDDPNLAHSLAWSLATCPDPRHRDAKEALALAGSLCLRTQRKDPIELDALAAAQAESGDFPAAAATARQAVALARQAGNAELEGQIQQRAALYAASRPYRQSP